MIKVDLKRKALIRSLRKDGFTYQEIANRLHISRQRTHQIDKNYNSKKLRFEPEQKYPLTNE